MKIFTENSVYVQMSDIIYLIKDLSIVLPECVSTEIYGKGNGIMEIDTTKKDKFIRFTDKDVPSGIKSENLAECGGPVIAWFDNGTIYLRTDADKVYLNEDSSLVFNFGQKYEFFLRDRYT